jgi:UDP-glucose:(heptosyl)LPS alpha-1,3-glucosyltransferase
MMKKQVVILKSSLNNNGGLEKNARHIAKAFLDNGYKVKILTTGYENKNSEFEIISFKTPLINLSYKKILQFDRKCDFYLNRHPSDIIFGMDRNSHQTHIRAGNGVHRAYLEMRKLNSKFLKRISFSFNPLHQTILNIEKKAFESPKLKTLFVNSYMIKNEILKYFSTDDKKIKVIHNGVQWEGFKQFFYESFEKKKTLCNHFKIPLDSIKLFFAGNGYERKGLKNLLKALSFFQKENLYLFIAGKDKNFTYYKKYVSKLKINNKVHFLGPLADLVSFYQLCDVFVLPTFYDPFANVILEALSMGLFVITTKNNGASEIINQNQGITLQNPFDIDEIKNAISHVLDKAKTKASSQKIRDSVARYDYHKQLKKLLDACL